ncbi:hypothetical protein [Pseudomonas nitroreducens]|uniref:hypothetical protein n=1 Tax=Pseudomonas nitroreducens TaxID=46680 RepID=UPI002658A903|nr:hypothetical protein [Pseudomonas nitroreducens]MCP1651662.1 hypothetical protein [Pseudomonas nitroreducens]MCP1684473.1 hypothetical protein [Pseudomonas nitroreducens]
MKAEKLIAGCAGVAVFAWLALLIAGAVGWGMNIYKIVNTGFVFAQWGGMEIARCIGVFVPPLGALLGYF